MNREADRAKALLTPVIIMIVVGIALRLYRYAANPSLWVDEAKLALNIVNSDIGGLLLPMINPPQFAPVGFVLSTKIITQIAGEGEYALRALPLLAGCLSLVFFYFLMKEVLGQGKGLAIGVGLFAVMETLIFHSVELKPYSLDVLLSILFLYWTLKLEKTDHIGNFIGYGIGGIVTILLSYAAPLVMGCCGLYSIMSRYRRRDFSAVALLGFFSIVWLALFWMNYKFFVLASPGFNSGLIEFWNNAFLRIPMDSQNAKKLIYLATEIFGEDPLKLFYPGLMLMFFLTGCVILASRNSFIAVLIVSPILLTIIVSMFGKYPFKGRMILFLVPSFLVMIASGMEWVLKVFMEKSRTIGVILICVIFFQPLIYQLYRIGKPNMGEEIKGVIESYADNKKSEDFLYVYYGARDAFEYYRPRYDIQPGQYRIGGSGRADWGRFDHDAWELAGYGRVWVLFSHVTDYHGVNEEKYMIHQLDRVGKLEEQYVSYGASIYRYDMTKGSPNDG